MSKTVWGNGVSMVERRTKRGVPRSWDPVLCPVGPWHSVQAQMEQLHSMNKEAAAAACISTGQSHGWEAEMCVCIDKKNLFVGVRRAHWQNTRLEFLRSWVNSLVP